VIDFEKHRRADGSINLLSAFEDMPARDWMELDQLNRVHDYLSGIEALREIVSRQAAAIALETAVTIAVVEDKS